MDPRTEKMLEAHRQSPAAAPPAAARPAGPGAWLQAHWLAVSIAAAAIAGAGGANFYLLVTVPSLKRAEIAMRVEAQQKEDAYVATHQAGLDACLAGAQSDFMTLWDAACVAHGAKPGCSLPADLVAQHDQRRRDARNACLKEYSLDAR